MRRVLRIMMIIIACILSATVGYTTYEKVHDIVIDSDAGEGLRADVDRY